MEMTTCAADDANLERLFGFFTLGTFGLLIVVVDVAHLFFSNYFLLKRKRHVSSNFIITLLQT
jgi:hypothetical protein